MTATAAVYCLYPGCGIRLTDPVSVERRYGPDHDPHPELRRKPRARTPPRPVAPPPRPQPDRDDEPSLLDLLTDGEPKCQP